MENSITAIFYTLLFVLSFIYTDLSIAGVGVPLLLILALLAAAFSGDTVRISYLKRIKSVYITVLLYLLYSVAFLTALYISSSIKAEDIRYFLSISLQFLWFPTVLFALLNNRYKFHHSLKYGVAICCFIMVVVWLGAFISTGDFFTLRNRNSTLTPDNFLFIPSIFSNPNLTARTSLLLLVCALYFRSVAVTRQGRKIWLLISLLLTMLIFLTLSRAVLSGAIILWAMYLMGTQKGMKKYSYLIIICFAILALIVTNPEISNRVKDGLYRISEISLGFKNEKVNARTTTIRGRTWAASIQIIRDNPIVGIGVSDSLESLRFYGAVHNKTGTEQAVWVHGGFLKIALYSGLLGLIPLLIIFLHTARSFLLKFQQYRFSTVLNNKFAGLIGLSFMMAQIAVNIGADSFGAAMTWFVIAFLMVESSVRWRNRIEA